MGPIFGGAGGAGGRAIFGAGTDGAFDLDGTNTYAAYFSKSGSVYTQLVDISCTTFRVRNGATWKPVCFRARGTTLTLDAGSLYDFSGTDASSSTGAAAAGGNTLFGSTAGGNSNAAAGSAGGNNTQAIGGSGGAGGAGSGGAGGAGGAASNTNSAEPNGYPEAWIGANNKLATFLGFVSGCGGGGGGGDGATAGGGGGSGGRSAVLCFRTMNIAAGAELRGTGGNGLTASVTNRGGGGGAGGGWLALIYEALSLLGSIDVAGGVGGDGGGAGGLSGVNGSAGRVFFIPSA